MKKIAVIACATLLLGLAAGAAQAADIAGKIGLVGRLGFLNPSSNEVISGGTLVNVGANVGLYGGGGVIYGIEHYLAADFEITHSSFGGESGTDGSTTDLALGAQFRFPEKNHFTPYAGAGVDILVNDYKSPGHSYDVDTTLGVHVKGGVDYFLTKELALNAELKAVISPAADIDEAGVKKGNFNPSSFSGSVGVRYFFN